MYVCMYVCMYVNISLSLYIYIYITDNYYYQRTFGSHCAAAATGLALLVAGGPS